MARLDALTRVHTFVEDIELSLDPDPIDVEVMQTEDGYAVKVTARSLSAMSRCWLIARLPTPQSMMPWSHCPQGRARLSVFARALAILNRPLGATGTSDRQRPPAHSERCPAR